MYSDFSILIRSVDLSQVYHESILTQCTLIIDLTAVSIAVLINKNRQIKSN